MDFEEAQTLFKDFYKNNGFELIDEDNRELFFKYRDFKFKVDEKEIEEYLDTVNNRFSKIPNECSICNLNYRENIIKYLNRFDNIRFRHKKYVFGDIGEGDIYVEFGKASNLFFNYFRLNEKYFNIYCERIGFIARERLLGKEKEKEFIDLKDIYNSPITIKIFNLKSKNYDELIEISNRIFDSCLFELSYLKDITIMLEENMQRSKRNQEEFNYSQNQEKFENIMPFPKVLFNSDTVRFYQLGMSTDIPVLKFLSFYQVLEYHYLKVADENLHISLANLIKDPYFSTSFSSIERLIKCFNDHSNQNKDEKEMLKNVLKKYVEYDVIKDFIVNYEDFLKEKIYTKKNKIFGNDVEVRLSEGHICSNIANIIKIIRNALVHSSDRYEKAERPIPFSESTIIVKKHIPLLKFLAERVIIATGTK